MWGERGAFGGPRQEPDSKRRGKGRGWRLAIPFFVLASAFLILSRTRADPDLWGHVLFGQLILRLRAIPDSDPYSYLATEWINHEWLAEFLFGLAFEVAGPAGLVALKVAVGMLVFTILYWLLVREGLDALRAGLICILSLVLLSFGTFPVRPQLFTYLFFLLVLLVIREVHRGGTGWLWALIPIFTLWANLHGGFLAGLGVLLLWSVGRLFVGWSRNGMMAGLRGSAPMWMATLASTAATLANPYGAELLHFVLITATVPRPEIVEWNPLGLTTVEGAFYLVLLGVLVWGVAASRRPLAPELMGILGVTALLPLQAVRHVPLFALAGIVLGAPHLASAYQRGVPGRDRPTRLGSFLVALLAAAGGLALVASAPNFRCIRVGGLYTEAFPAGAVAQVQEAGVTANMATFFNWGEYVIWHLGPEVQVSMDGRRETVYPDSIYLEYRRFMGGLGKWDALLETRPTDLALVPRGYAAFNLLQLKPGWELAYEDSLSGLFGRAGSEELTALREVTAAQPTAAATGCFP